jgi:glycosyltransferase involved in cell wall biosynthesis
VLLTSRKRKRKGKLARSAAERGQLRVAYIDHTAELSGGEIALLRLLSGLPDVRPIVILGEDGPLAERLRSAGVETEVLSLGAVGAIRKDSLSGPASVVSGGMATFRYVRALSRRLRDLNPDIVHTNSLKSGYYGCLAARLAGIPAVWHLRDRLSRDYLPRVAVWVTRIALLTLPTAVICNSRETLRTTRGVRFMAVVASPVIYDAHADIARVWDRARCDHRFTVVMVGRLAPWKGQNLFLEAFDSALAGTESRARIVGSAMFGEVEYEDSLRRLVSALDLADKVEFVGFSHDIAKELSDADVLVHASLIPEPFGQVIVEGMAAGLPVVAADAGGPAEIIADGVDGLLYPPGDKHALAQHLRRLYEDADLREKLASAAIVRSRDFRPEVTGAQVMALYSRVLK